MHLFPKTWSKINDEKAHLFWTKFLEKKLLVFLEKITDEVFRLIVYPEICSSPTEVAFTVVVVVIVVLVTEENNAQINGFFTVHINQNNFPER